MTWKSRSPHVSPKQAGHKENYKPKSKGLLQGLRAQRTGRRVSLWMGTFENDLRTWLRFKHGDGRGMAIIVPLGLGRSLMSSVAFSEESPDRA